MLKPVANNVLVHESEFMHSNAVIVQGPTGILLIDAGILQSELVALAADLHDLGQPIVAGFSTHPHWDHLLWHPSLGPAPRYGTAACAAAIAARLADPHWKSFVATMMPPDIADQVPLELFGDIKGLPAEATQIPWDGPKVRIIEHQAHAPGHAALLIEDHGVLVAGDMLSDILIPILNLNGAADPVEDYLAALSLLQGVAASAKVVIPGHGSVGDANQAPARIAQDQAYVNALRDGRDPSDPRLAPSAYGKDFLPAVHNRQVQYLAQ